MKQNNELKVSYIFNHSHRSNRPIPAAYEIFKQLEKNGNSQASKSNRRKQNLQSIYYNVKSIGSSQIKVHPNRIERSTSGFATADHTALKYPENIISNPFIPRGWFQIIGVRCGWMEWFQHNRIKVTYWYRAHPPPPPRFRHSAPTKLTLLTPFAKEMASEINCIRFSIGESFDPVALLSVGSDVRISVQKRNSFKSTCAIYVRMYIACESIRLLNVLYPIDYYYMFIHY